MISPTITFYKQLLLQKIILNTTKLLAFIWFYAFLSNTNNFLKDQFDQQMELQQVLPLWVREILEEIDDFTFPKTSVLKPYNWMQLHFTLRTPLF